MRRRRIAQRGQLADLAHPLTQGMSRRTASLAASRSAGRRIDNGKGRASAALRLYLIPLSTRRVLAASAGLSSAR